MRKILRLFQIHREERWPALLLIVLFTVLNALVIHKYATQFTLFHKNYRAFFIQTFHISGYDPLTYEVVSQWTTGYNIYRHPLLAFLMYPVYGLNQGLITLTGLNCVQFVVAVLLLFCTLYTFIFLLRIFKELIGLPQVDALLLAFLTFSFAYVLVASIVPDHFILSMFILIFTLYVNGRRQMAGRPLTRWQTVGLFLLTAGISLTNGIKVFLAALFTNRRRFFKPSFLLPAVILPVIGLGVFAQWEFDTFEKPKNERREAFKVRSEKRQRAKLFQAYQTANELKDSVQIAAIVDSVMRLRALEAYQKQQQEPNVAHKGTPIAQVEFLNWSDISTSRGATCIENLFGESFILHREHLLEDTLAGRPVIVRYRSALPYIAEGLIICLFLCGIWCGRRSRLMWMSLSFFGFDLLLHLLIGFGINEVYIMTPHWAFVPTITTGFLFKTLRGRKRILLRGITACLAGSLLVYNVTLIVQYLLR